MKICSRPRIATSASARRRNSSRPLRRATILSVLPDDEADKAMRAFFEADFETSDPQEQKSRFGFRR